MEHRYARQIPGYSRELVSLVLGVFAAALVAILAVLLGINPYTYAESTMQQRGALHSNDSVSIVSHRGAAALAPENTLAALRVGLAEGVEFVEADVQLTSDGVPVMMHDLTVDRTTNGWGDVADKTFAQIRALDAGAWFDDRYRGEKVPTLAEYLAELSPANARALVELKGDWTVDQIVGVTEMLTAHHLVNRVALQSFEVEILEELQLAAPNFARVMLTREWDERVVAQATELEVSAVGGRPKVLGKRLDLVDELRADGVGLLYYTLNKEPLWSEAVRSGADMIVTDDPVLLEEWRVALAAADAEADAALTDDGASDHDAPVGSGIAALVAPRTDASRTASGTARPTGSRARRAALLGGCAPPSRTAATAKTPIDRRPRTPAAFAPEPDSAFLPRG